MQNLDQIRAKNALAATGAKNGNNYKFTRAHVAGFPALIIQNGLLSAFAYATENGKRPELQFACDSTADHLSRHGIPVLEGKTNAEDLIRALSSEGTSSDLQRATAEALLFFGYLKRFAAKEQPEANARA